MNLEAHFEFDTILSYEGFLELLLTLPKALRPTRVGPDEDVGKDWVDIGDNRRIKAFLRKFPAGFFLRSAQDASFMLNTGQNTDWSLYIYGIDNISEDELKELILCMAKLDLQFGCVCMDDEYCHRNRVYGKFRNGSAEGWVGRDISRYIPGLYWKTLVSRKLLDKHTVEPSDIVKCGFEQTVFNKGALYLFTGSYSATDWQDVSRKIDDCCHGINGIFSKRDVEKAVKTAEGFWEFHAATKEYR